MYAASGLGPRAPPKWELEVNIRVPSIHWTALTIGNGEDSLSLSLGVLHPHRQLRLNAATLTSVLNVQKEIDERVGIVQPTKAQDDACMVAGESASERLDDA